MDLAATSYYFALDVISEIAFGKAIGNLDADNDLAAYIKATEETIPFIVFLGVFPWLARIAFSWPCKYFLPMDEDTAGLGKLMGFVIFALL